MDLFFYFLSIDLDTIEFYTDGSLAENKSSGKMVMGSGWVSLHGNRSFCCKTSTWPSSTRAELLAIYTALLTVPNNKSVVIKTDSQAAIDRIKKSSTFIKKFQWTNISNHTLIHNISHITKFKSLSVEYVKVKEHSGLDGNDMADN